MQSLEMMWLEVVFMMVGGCIFGAIVCAVLAFVIYKFMDADDRDAW